MNILSKVSLKTILMTACVTFALVPPLIVGAFAWRSAIDSAQERAESFGTAAANLADKIDRNLFERYGDVQAFGLNHAVRNENDWYVAGEDNPIVQAMNSYVDTYDIYYLTLLVDLDGDLIAVNTRDDSGKPVNTNSLYEKNFAEESWFKDSLAGRFYESEDGSFTGTVMEHLYVDQDVASIYGDEGLSLGYSAPVYGEDGKVIAVWKNVTKFELVESIVLSAYQDLKAQGLGSAEVTLLDKEGNVIVDCDPTLLGREEIQRDLDIIGKFNLAGLGVEAAQRVVAGEAGSILSSYHTRKKLDQVAGFAPFKGALGFPGMEWNALVRVASSEALATANAAKRLSITVLVTTAVVVALASWFFSGTICGVLGKAVESMKLAGKNDFSKRLETGLSKDLSSMGSALNSMLDSLAASEVQAEEAHKLRRVVEDSDSALMLVDRDLVVTYTNKATRGLLKTHEEIFKKQFPGFDPDAIVGACIDQFYTVPSHQRNLLGDPNNLPYRTDIKIGPVTFELLVSAMIDTKGAYIGNTLIWADVTELRDAQARNADYQSQLEAINKAQAVIEFNVKGEIQSANENFCLTTGYGEDEIVGKHHRIFVDPEYATSAEYKAFWEKLANGEFISGEFLRFAKDGSEVWMQAAYNPIFDIDGNISKVVKFASDISASKKMEKEIAESRERERLSAEDQQRRVNELLGVVNAVAAGDMSVTMPDLGDDSVGQVARGVSEAIESIRVALSQVNEVSAIVAQSSQELAQASDEISNGAQTQASSLEETAASLEEITATVKQNSDNCQQAQQLSSSSREVAESGGEVVSQAVDAMTSINAASKKIAEIITTIDEIAFQTNLLALNAAVEAARAGEQGRGFAVVASEVRNLAQRSAGAAKEIKSLIQDSVQKVDNGTELVNRSGETLKEIVTSVKRVADIVTEISAASTEQLSGVEQVNGAVSQMDRVTQTNAAQTEEMAGTSQSLLTHSEQLQQLVSAFKLGDSAAEGLAAAGRFASVKPPAPQPGWDAGESADTELQDLDLVGAGADGEFIEF